MDVVIIAGSDRVAVSGRERLLAGLMVGGITLLQRAVRAAQVAGASRVLVLGPEDAALRGAVERDRWRKVPIEWRRSELPCADAVKSLLTVRSELSGSFWVLTADRVVSPGCFPSGQ